jgi:hypothetical protein
MNCRLERIGISYILLFDREFEMELDILALAILMTSVFKCKWCIKCGEYNMEILTCKPLAFCFAFMSDFWWLLSALQTNSGISSNTPPPAKPKYFWATQNFITLKTTWNTKD